MHHKPANTSGSDPFFQFAWLRRKLTEAARDKRKVWIAGPLAVWRFLRCVISLHAKRQYRCVPALEDSISNAKF